VIERVLTLLAIVASAAGVIAMVVLLVRGCTS
jgi:hypothetical protein